MFATIPRMVRNSFCKVGNRSRMFATSFWMVDNVSGRLSNVENEVRTRFRMVPNQFVLENWTVGMFQKEVDTFQNS